MQAQAIGIGLIELLQCFGPEPKMLDMVQHCCFLLNHQCYQACCFRCRGERACPWLLASHLECHSVRQLSVIDWSQEPGAEPVNHVVPPDARRHVERDESILLAPGNEYAGVPVLLNHHLAASLHAATTTATATTPASPPTSPAQEASKLSKVCLLSGEVVGVLQSSVTAR